MVGPAHTTQTTGVALATDLRPAETRPRVVALLYVMLLLAWWRRAASACAARLQPLRLVRVIQGTRR